jgi:hypothetical protein
MIAGVSWVWWVGFHAVVAAVLLADSFLPGHRRESRHAQAFVWVGIAGLVLAAAGFACWIAVAQGRADGDSSSRPGTRSKTSLSIDNLFVFMVLFQGFRISAQRQHKALMWGVCFEDRRGFHRDSVDHDRVLLEVLVVAVGEVVAIVGATAFGAGEEAEWRMA